MTDNKLLFEGCEWDADTLRRIDMAVSKIAFGELGLDVYPVQLEVISSEQMLDRYATTGLPVMYTHWSFGKRRTQHGMLYERGLQNLAYEIVINSNPCLVYLMESNTATMQALVIAHAAYGHNHFYKNNYLFRQWTRADEIIDYLTFAQKYISRCEERYGRSEVELLLDAAHALAPQGVSYYAGKKRKTDLRSEEARSRERAQEAQRNFNYLWASLGAGRSLSTDDLSKRKEKLNLPDENLLRFVEKHSPRLQPWQREIIRIVRNIEQYFLPQRETKVMNEGCATFVHYQIMNRLLETGQITQGHYLEFLQSHCAAISQPTYQQSEVYNPYALGFGIMQDIKRIVTNPEPEDVQWYPDIAGTGDYMAVLRDVWANYRDDGFIAQFLSPHMMRKWRMFALDVFPQEGEAIVRAIHDEDGYRILRKRLSDQYNDRLPVPYAEDVDLLGDRTLMVRYDIIDDERLEPNSVRQILKYLAQLWGYPVELREVTSDGTVASLQKEVP